MPEQLSLLDSLCSSRGSPAVAVAPVIAEVASFVEKPVVGPNVIAVADRPTADSLIEDTIDAYRNHLKAELKKDSTVISFVPVIRHLGSVFPEKPVSDFLKEDIEAFIVLLSDDLHNKDKTLGKKIPALKNYFKYLKGTGAIPWNPAAAIVFKRPKIRLPEILTSAEELRFVHAAPRAHEQVLTILLLGGGLKRSELMSLRIRDIDINNEDSPTVKIEADEKLKQRTIVLPIDFVDSWKKYLEEEKSLHIPGDAVFDYTAKTYNNILKTIAARAGIEKNVSCNILRDTFAVKRLRAGDEIDDVMRKLGLAEGLVNEEAMGKYRLLREQYP